MFDTLSYERFIDLATADRRITVYKEIPGDKLTPVNAYLALEHFEKAITLLESSPKDKTLGRYSYLCFDPTTEIKSYGHQVFVNERLHSKVLNSDPFLILKAYQLKLYSKADHALSGFAGGMVGLMSYDAIRLIENIPNKNKVDDNVPDLFFRFYSSNITFDHQTGKVVVSIVAEIDDDNDLKNVYQRTVNKIDYVIKQLLLYRDNEDSLNNVCQESVEIYSDIDDENYRKIVDVAKQSIIAGDVFQVVLSRKFSVHTREKPFDIYRALRFTNPSPYMFYFAVDDCVIAGSSPEKLISVKDRVIESCPLAGTRLRDKVGDNEIEEALLADKKELAEHMMLVDLSRNDVGAVSVPGTVKVTKLKEIEKYSRVMHISSTVQGILREDKDVFDVIKAAFPAGTLSGAPKISAMTLIDKLENSRRGVYGGAICAIDSLGNLDSCIAIRTIFIKNNIASVRTGAGIVFDSEAKVEADETRHKAKAMLEAILLAKGKKS